MGDLLQSRSISIPEHIAASIEAEAAEQAAVSRLAASPQAACRG